MKELLFSMFLLTVSVSLIIVIKMKRERDEAERAEKERLSIASLKVGDHVFDNVHKTLAVVQKNDKDVGYLLLDKSFGVSTSFRRKQYIADHGNDGRYSVAHNLANGRIIKVYRS